MTWNCDECYSQKQLCESCAKKQESFIAVEATRIDLDFNDSYNNATEDQKDRIWEIAKHKLGDMLMQDDRYSECLEYCIERGLEN